MPWVKKFGCVFLGFFSFFIFGLCHVQGKGREGRARGRQTKTGRKLKNRKQQKEKRLIQRPREGKWQGNVPRPPRPWARARHGRQERPASPKDRAVTANAASERREGDRCERDRCGQAGVFLIRSDSENVQQPDRRRHAYGRLTWISKINYQETTSERNEVGKKRNSI